MLTYFPIIDILRFIAAFGVMCYHYFGTTFSGHNDIFSIFVQYGFLGVELFFIISGFVIFFSVTRSTKEYAIGRFLRLYPIFWVICTITYIATLVFPNGDPLPFTMFLKNLLIISNGKTANMVDGVYWTLTIEILFYIYIGIYAFLFKKKNLHLFFIGWLAISFVTFLTGFQNMFIAKILLTRYAPYFAFGGLLAFLYSNRQVMSKKFKYFILSIIGVTPFLPYYISYVLNNDPVATATNSFGVFDTKANIIVFLFFIIIPLAIYLSEKVTQKWAIKMAKILGGITYPLYILHDKLGSLIIGQTFGTLTIISATTALGMVLASWLISSKEEKWRKDIYKKLINYQFINKSK